MVKCMIRFNILSVKKVMLHILLFIFLQKVELDSYDSLPPEKAMTFDNIIIFIKSVFNENKSNCYYNIFLGKASYKLSIT